MPRQTLFLSAGYLKMVVRSFYRNRAYTLLNLLGLSLGFAVFIFALLYVQFETSFECFHQKSGQIYRVTYEFDSGNSFNAHWARVPLDYINELPNELPEVKTLIRFQNQERKYIRIGNEKFLPDHAYVTDSDVFKVLDFKLLAGDPVTALASPHAVVLSKKMATRHFGNTDPIGKDVYVIGDFDQAETLHRVTGVMEDLPANTHLPVDMLISFRNKEERAGWAYTYVLLNENSTAAAVEEKLPAFVAKFTPDNTPGTDKLHLQPLADIHLHSNLAREIVPNGKIFYVRVVAFAGVFILLIALINFMNLNSAMALGRAKEIGVRKVMGATRQHLVYYLLTDAVLQTLAALAMGAILVYATLPWFRQFVTLELVADPWLLGLLLCVVALVCGIVAGIYPALMLVSLKPMEVVKTTKVLSLAKREKPFNLKRVMITLQFAVSVLLLGSAFMAYNQFAYIQRKNLGMQREQVLAIPGVPDQVKDQYETFRQALQAQPGISQVAACMEVPSREIRDAGPVLVEGVNSDRTKAPVMDIQVIDPGFAAMLNLEFVGGQNIADALWHVPTLTDTYTLQTYLGERPRSYLINETAMRQLGWSTPAEAIGQRISWSLDNLVLATGPIVGVVRDFHQETLKNKVDPTVLVYEPVWLRTFLVKVDAQNVQQSIASVQQTWDRLFPYYPMTYFFLDDLYDNLYKGERVQLQLLFLFSGLAIVVAFIGLVGMVAYALRTRAKEIAVRKVLGASVGNLAGMMGREYMVVLLVGAALAIPVSVYGVKQWLSGFAYRVDVSPVSYAMALGLVVLLLVITVGLQTLRAAAVNPADALRDE